MTSRRALRDLPDHCEPDEKPNSAVIYGAALEILEQDQVIRVLRAQLATLGVRPDA